MSEERSNEAGALYLGAAQVPVELRAPKDMWNAVAEVLAGEYEAGYFGEGLQILDIGANVGSFAVWATARWPGSSIQSFEPNPGTFAMLQANVAKLANVQARHFAVYPSDAEHIAFVSRYDGDGEAGVSECMRDTFATLPEHEVQVPVLHPRALSRADVIKLDVEGAEADILEHMDLSGVSLVLLEYQNDKARAAIRRLLEADFETVFEDEFPWSDLLPGSQYRSDLTGDHWGRMFFARRQGCKLRRLAPPRTLTTPAPAVTPAGLPRRLARRIKRSLRAVFRAA